VTALNRKVWGDLVRYRTRTLLSIGTLSLALASFATLAVPGLMDRAMGREVRAARLHDVAVATRDLALTPAQARTLRQLPDVAALDARIEYPAEVMAAGRRQAAVIWGLDLAAPPVDTVQLAAGQWPGPGELLADAGDGPVAGLPAAIGSQVHVGRDAGLFTPLRGSGIAHSLATSPSAAGDKTPAFYASEATVRALAGLRGVNYLVFRLTDQSPGARARAVAAIHAYLKAQTGTEPFTALPVTRGPGDWPGRSFFGQIIALFYVITLLAVGCALFLIASTMNTIVVEQAAEIAILKTLGGRSRQIAGIILRTAAVLGAAGAAGGVIFGIIIAYVLTRYFASSLFQVQAGFAISLPVTAATVVAGPVLAMAASLPGLRRAVRRPVAETLADRGVAGYGGGWLDRQLARSRLLPGAARIGVRNALRRKRRSAATVAQLAVAIGMALALFATGRSAVVAINQAFGGFSYDIEVDSSAGAAVLDGHALSVAARTPGITRVEPLIESKVQYRGGSYAAYGLGARPAYAYHLSAGRWFTAADASAAASSAAVPPVVLGPAFAQAAQAVVGQALTVRTAAGPTRVRVIGIDTSDFSDGHIVYFPLPVLQRLTAAGRAANAIWLTTASPAHAAVDRAANAVTDRLVAPDTRSARKSCTPRWRPTSARPPRSCSSSR
jgi:putative ABC transport system permease protein